MSRLIRIYKAKKFSEKVESEKPTRLTLRLGIPADKNGIIEYSQCRVYCLHVLFEKFLTFSRPKVLEARFEFGEVAELPVAGE